jgi:hypothetical protein
MKKSVFLAAILVSATPTLFAHDAHNHEAAVESAPHGGTLRNAGDLKAEIVIKGDAVKLYIYDKQLKPAKLDVAEFKGEVQFPKEKAKPIIFKRVGDLYEVTIKGISKTHRYDMHVNVEVGGKKALADFGVDNI